jgi:hypothetical protein
VVLFESALCEKARLARPLPKVFGTFGAESFAPHRERPIAPALPVGIHGPGYQIVADATLSQLITDLQRTLPTGCPVCYETLCESLVGQEILGLEHVQLSVDKRLRESPRSELTAQLDARMLSARK